MTDAVEKGPNVVGFPLREVVWAGMGVLPGRRLGSATEAPAQLRDGCTHFGCWRAEQSQRHSLEILDDCGEVEFVRLNKSPRGWEAAGGASGERMQR